MSAGDVVANENLSRAKAAKKDEFYTQLEDIERELAHYTAHFAGKTVLCNCDDPRVSNFFHYFAYSFDQLHLKRLVTTCYKSQSMELFSQGDSERAIWLEYTGQTDGGRVPTVEEIGLHQLAGDGDFRSPECIALLEQADIVVTNPPFSLFREYVAQLVEYDKKFLIIGNKNAITYKEIFPLIKENKLWVGWTPITGSRWFEVPPDYENKFIKCVDGKRLVPIKAVWFTNLDHAKRHEPLILYRSYSPNEYPHYDNYDAIEVSKTCDIPADYDGVMGVPITFLDKYCPEQFEILGATQRGCHDLVPDTRKYDDYREMTQAGRPTGSSGSKTNENANLLQNDGRKNYFVNDEGRVVQSAYQRLFIRRRVGHS